MIPEVHYEPQADYHTGQHAGPHEGDPTECLADAPPMANAPDGLSQGTGRPGGFGRATMKCAVPTHRQCSWRNSRRDSREESSVSRADTVSDPARRYHQTRCRRSRSLGSGAVLETVAPD